MGLMDQFGEGMDYKKLLEWVDQQGGVNELLGQLKEGGLKDSVSSWVGEGANKAVSPDSIQSALSSETLTSLASALGVDASKASSLLAEYLPQIVDLLSPNGEKPQDGGLLSMGLNLIKKKLLG